MGLPPRHGAVAQPLIVCASPPVTVEPTPHPRCSPHLGPESALCLLPCPRMQGAGGPITCRIVAAIFLICAGSAMVAAPASIAATA